MAQVALLIRALDGSGGAEQSMLTLKRHLEETHRHEVQMFGIGSRARSKGDVTAIPLFSRRRTYVPVAVGNLGRYVEGFARFRKAVTAYDPDVILSQHELSILGARLRESTGTPHILFLRDYEMVSRVVDADRHPLGTTVDRLLWPIRRPIVRYIVENTDATIANSQYVASVYRDEWDISPAIVYPFVDISDYETSREGDAILHVTPTKSKGIDITLAVADRLPDEEFLVVGTKATSRVQDAMISRSNVTYEGYCENMRDIYRRSKLVLVPSRWHEPFGRIPIEAGASGVPAVSSSKGGLPEAVSDDERVVDSMDPNAYVETIERVFSMYERYSERAQRNAREKRAESQLQQFDDILRRVASDS